MKKFLSALKYVLFLAIGIAVFYYIYKEFKWDELKGQLSSLKWGWIVLGLAIGLVSHTCRALRWNMLINPLGYKTNLFRTFCAVMSMYFTNLIIPRGGEFVRCTALNRSDRIPFAVLLGTVVVERSVDIILLIVLVIITFCIQLPFFKDFFSQPGHEIDVQKFELFLSPWFWVITVLACVAIVFVLWKMRKTISQWRIMQPVIELMHKFLDGLKSVTKLKNPWLFGFYSLFIYFTYFLMTFVVFYSFEPTQNLTFSAGLTTFIMGGLAMLVPVQGGIGPWHFMVYETLALYGIQIADGKVFALICHTSTNAFMLVVGAACLVYLTLVGRQNTNIEQTATVNEK
ncbi:MAG: flippase-like domain-containing protein [Salinivirgaceae bacterium]|nr:flippase-like domain-containing protein [Salinivirgaceae bacterium]